MFAMQVMVVKLLKKWAKTVGAAVVHTDSHFDILGKFMDLKLESFISEFT